MNLETANRNIKYVWMLSAIGTIVAVGFHLGLNFSSSAIDNIVGRYFIQSFIPWLFPGRSLLPASVIVSALTYLVYRKSRLAVILLFVVYFYERALMLLFLHDLPKPYIVVWFIFTIIWGLFFIQGIRGTFAYKRIKKMTPVEGQY